MAVYTVEVATEFNFPNITVYKKLEDGVHYAWRINPNEGYVMYDTRDENYEPVIDPDTGLPQTDPETGEMIEVPVTYYYTVASLPLQYDFANFPWVAVLRSSVDENYIFGLPENEHEII